MSNNKVTREFPVSSWAVDNRATVLVLVIIMFLSGMVSYLTMPKESFPEVVIPEIYVGTPYPGNSPLDIENLVTRPIEKELNTISDVDKITSTSIQDYSTIIVKFSSDMDVEEALRKVKDAVDKSKRDLPSDLDQEPNVFELNFSEMPIMNINLSGDYSIDKLKEYGEYLEERIENLPEITKVDIRGSREREVKIDVDVHKMEALKISFNDIANAVSSENRTTSGGIVKSGGLERTVRIVGEFERPEKLNDIIVKDEKSNIVYLEDIADISFDYEDRKSYARQDMQPVVMLDVVKRSGENLLKASSKINKIVEEARQAYLPENLKVSITNDQSDMTRNQVNNLENSIISGVILVVLILLFFLGIRNALFVGIAIPLSMFMAFMILGAMGVTMNIMVLFSLILALGMLVDNGIVIVENIYRLMDQGFSPIQAAKEGAGEVAWPIISSTATTLAAFLPLAFWPGMMGEFMYYLPVTLMIVLGSSLFVALVINPVLTSKYMRIGEEGTTRARKINMITIVLLATGAIVVAMGLGGEVKGLVAFGNLILVAGGITWINYFLLTPGTKWFQRKAIPALESQYEKFLTFALAHTGIFFGGTIVLLFLSIALMAVFPPKIEFFPINQPHYLNIFIEKPIGTDIEVTNEFTKKIEKIVAQEIGKYNDTVMTENGPEVKNYLIKSVIAQVGEGTSDPMEGISMGVTPHKARIMISFVEYEFRRGVNTTDVMNDIRKTLRGFPGVQITVDKDAAGPPVGKPIQIEISGEDYQKLITTTEKVKRFINEASIPGIEELKTNLELGKPELTVDINRKAARRYGISTGQIASEIRTALFGMEVSKYKEGEDDYPIQVRLDEEYRNNPEMLLNQRITFRDPSTGRIKQVPISAVAEMKRTSTYGSIRRKDLDRVAMITSNVIEGYNANEIVLKIKELLKNYELPVDQDLKFTGQQEEQAKEMSFLSTALMIAVFLIFLIIVAQFNSATIPFMIMFSVLFSTIGVFLGLVFTGMDFIVIMTMIGIISLAGVVVNNAIVLIDYTNLIRERKKIDLGMSPEERLPVKMLIESIIEGGKTRLRPVLLTAITTVFGLVPLAVGLNINFFTLFTDFDPQIYTGGDNVIFWGPMSWTVIFGLTFSTFLTLVILPVMYLLNERLGIFFRGLFSSN